jgi:FKBP-type peptidyl-prolyl cis-trans isomerase SlyD
MTIQDGKVVGLSYALKNSKGDLLDQADGHQPFVYMHGAQQIVPGLEDALGGLKIGDKKNVVVAPEDGYGEMNPQLKMTVKRDQFPGVAEIQAGMQFQAQGPDGGPGMVFTISEIKGDEVMIDGNHPLAGETLHFAVEILSIRDATPEEMSHGHVHGEGGHHH